MNYQYYGIDLEIYEDDGDTGSSLYMDENNGVGQVKKHDKEKETNWYEQCHNILEGIIIFFLLNIGKYIWFENLCLGNEGV